MVSLLSGKSLKIAIALFLAFQSACIFFTQEKPLNPILLFTVGSSFLDNAKTLGLKGDIDYFDGKTTQSGRFAIFINGQDSLALLIEGPLNINILQMVVFGDSGYFYSNEEDRWIDYNEWLDSNKKNYGISDISPLMIGAFVFPQFFLNLDNSKSQDGDVRLEHKHETLLARRQQDLKEFAIYDITPNQDLAPVGTYARRKDFETGYYPSQVKITCNGCPWKVTLNITKLRLNLLIPHQVWEMQ